MNSKKFDDIKIEKLGVTVDKEKLKAAIDKKKKQINKPVQK